MNTKLLKSKIKKYPINSLRFLNTIQDIQIESKKRMINFCIEYNKINLIPQLLFEIEWLKIIKKEFNI